MVDANRHSTNPETNRGAWQWSRALWLMGGGFAASILVAWCLAVFAEPLTGRMTRITTFTARPRVPREWSSSQTASELVGLGRRLTSLHYAEGYAAVQEYGWPFRCMSYHFVYDGVNGWVLPDYSSDRIAVPLWVPLRKGSWLPLNPRWKGLGLNAGLYATAGGIVVAVASGIRRRVRDSAGRCVECGYQLSSGLKVCPECGAPRHIAAEG